MLQSGELAQVWRTVDQMYPDEMWLLGPEENRREPAMSVVGVTISAWRHPVSHDVSLDGGREGPQRVSEHAQRIRPARSFIKLSYIY